MDVGVLACNRHLVVVKSHLLGEEIRDFHQIERGQSFLIFRCNAYFNAEKFVPASAVIINLSSSCKFPLVSFRRNCGKQGFYPRLVLNLNKIEIYV